ncbi:MAG: hypothetical protein ACPL3C_02910 [Pyrobaculum sp.]
MLLVTALVLAIGGGAVVLVEGVLRYRLSHITTAVDTSLSTCLT